MVSDPISFRIFFRRRFVFVACAVMGVAHAAAPAPTTSEAGAGQAASTASAPVQRLFAQFAALGERRAAFVERRVSVLFRNPPEARSTLYFKQLRQDRVLRPI